MKTYSNVVALCLLQGAAAFSVKGHTRAMASVRLNSSTNDQVSTGVGVDIASGGPEGAAASALNTQTSRAAEGSPNSIWDTLSPVIVQGSSLRTWSFETPLVERVQVLLKTEGRPLSANVELWQGPDNTPQKMGIYIEDASMRPFSCVVETPRGSNSIAVRNTGHLEFPLLACVEADVDDGNGGGLKAFTDRMREIKGRIVQGGAVHTIPFPSSVESVQISLETDGRPLNARIELLQGPNNIKQVIELYTEDGLDRPLFAVLETPGTGNVVRIVNTATVEFPLTAVVEPYLVDPNKSGEYEQGYDMVSLDRR